MTVQCMERKRVFNPCLYKHAVTDIAVLRHGDNIATLATRAHIAEFKEHLSKHLLVKHVATFCSQTVKE